MDHPHADTASVRADDAAEAQSHDAFSRAMDAQDPDGLPIAQRFQHQLPSSSPPADPFGYSPILQRFRTPSAASRWNPIPPINPHHAPHLAPESYSGTPLRTLLSPPPRAETDVALPPISSWAQDINGFLSVDADAPSHCDAVDLSGFLGVEFSSPSSYPPFTTHAGSQLPQAAVAAAAAAAEASASASTPTRRQAPTANPSTAAPRNYSDGCLLNDPETPSRSAAQPTSFTSASNSQTTFPPHDSYLDFEGLFDSPGSPLSDSMPQLRSRPSEAAPPPETRANKRRRTSTTTSALTPLRKGPPSRKQPRASRDSYDSLFDGKPSSATPGAELASDDLTTIDLTETNEVPEVPAKPTEDTRVRISAFQCVICMDDVTTLTVTHCGHLFCAQCLHSALQVEATKGKCPMCRQKLDLKPRDSYTSKTKGYWPLELKFTTAARNGKRKADGVL